MEENAETHEEEESLAYRLYADLQLEHAQLQMEEEESFTRCKKTKYQLVVSESQTAACREETAAKEFQISELQESLQTELLSRSTCILEDWIRMT